jgi:hypothetical protein
MKRHTRNRLIGSLLAAVLLAGTGGLAQAQSTSAGTSVTNKATVGYSVGGVTQTSIESSPTGNSTPGTGKGSATSFVVDNKLALSVVKVDSSIVNVSPGQSGTVMVYKVTNNGNDTQGVSFTTKNESTGTTNPFSGQPNDNFDVNTPAVHVSKGNTSTYNASNDTASAIAQLAPGASQFVFVVSDIPLSQTNGDSATVGLIAQVADKGVSATYGTAPGSNITSDDSGNAWTPGTMQKIFADAAGTDDSQYDGKTSDRNAVLVQSASLEVTKTASVVSDPTGSSTPHAIPGAVMQYTITVKNTAPSGSGHAASGVSVNDDLSAETSASGPLDDSATAGTIKYTPPGGSAATCNSSSSPSCSYTSHKLTTGSISLNGGQTATFTFQVKIK